MNKVILMGRLTADPDISTANNRAKTVIARFTVAVNYDEEHANFIRCTTFDKTAELVERALRKGKKILVEGRWQTGSYEDEDGETVYTNECIVSRIEFCEKKEDDDNSDDNKSGSRRAKKKR